MEFIDRMRNEGYRFFILMKDFGFDIPHER